MNLMSNRGGDTRGIVYADFRGGDFKGRIGAALYDLRTGKVGDDAAGGRLGRQHGKLLLNCLKLADRLAELRPFIGIGHRLGGKVGQGTGHLAGADQGAVEPHRVAGKTCLCGYGIGILQHHMVARFAGDIQARGDLRAG